MRFMMIVKADRNTEAGVLPTEAQLADMAEYNEQLVKSGILLAAEGIQATSKGARIRFDGDKRTVVDGPFENAKDLIAGFWIIQADSKADAIEWARRVPFHEGEVEVRQLFELDDFAPSDARELHRQLSEQIGR
jgi:hypothetical protein